MSALVFPIEEAIGFRFKRRELLHRALTHSSHRGEAGLERVPDADNEQLEFLGDAVLGLVVSEHLIRECPDLDEGRLSNVKSRLVNRAHLAEIARRLGVGLHLAMGKGEERSGGREKSSVLANAFEALLGAVYLDGGLDAARRFVLKHIVADSNLRLLANAGGHNVKTALEVLARERGLAKPEYSVRAENSGFPHLFEAEVRVSKDWFAAGRGSSKKAAESEAARVLLARMEGGGTEARGDPRRLDSGSVAP